MGIGPSLLEHVDFPHADQAMLRESHTHYSRSACRFALINTGIAILLCLVVISGMPPHYLDLNPCTAPRDKAFLPP